MFKKAERKKKLCKNCFVWRIWKWENLFRIIDGTRVR